MFSFIRKHWKVFAIVGACWLLMGIGYGFASWYHSARIAGYDKREAQRMAEIATKDAEQNKLRGENEAIRRDSQQLREQIAKLSAQDEAIKAITDSRGGQVAAEVKNLEALNENLKNNLEVIKNPADSCVRCKALSADALARKQIGRPLKCEEECGGAAR